MKEQRKNRGIMSFKKLAKEWMEEFQKVLPVILNDKNLCAEQVKHKLESRNP